ncbi:MAG TPA: WhiB family transcriptional regulator, partial [Acidimicrobiales bacterium]|nr:WhiB family transcriptional regulator [Acidimicrobiales bacterium]
PVRAECLEYALETNQEHGVWGGMGEDERLRERRRRRRHAARRAS